MRTAAKRRKPPEAGSAIDPATRLCDRALSILFLGFFLGLKHATDADHVIAVTTIVSRQRSVEARP